MEITSEINSCEFDMDIDWMDLLGTNELIQTTADDFSTINQPNLYTHGINDSFQHPIITPLSTPCLQEDTVQDSFLPDDLAVLTDLSFFSACSSDFERQIPGLLNKPNNADTLTQTTNYSSTSNSDEIVINLPESHKQLKEYAFPETVKEMSSSEVTEAIESILQSFNERNTEITISHTEKEPEEEEDSDIEIIHESDSNKENKSSTINKYAYQSRASREKRSELFFKQTKSVSQVFNKIERVSKLTRDIITCMEALDKCVTGRNNPNTGIQRFTTWGRLILAANKNILQTEPFTLTREEFFNSITHVKEPEQDYKPIETIRRKDVYVYQYKLTKLQALLSGYLSMFMGDMLKSLIINNTLAAAWRFKAYQYVKEKTSIFDNCALLRDPYGEKGFHKFISAGQVKNIINSEQETYLINRKYCIPF